MTFREKIEEIVGDVHHGISPESGERDILAAFRQLVKEAKPTYKCMDSEPCECRGDGIDEFEEAVLKALE